MTKFSDDGPDLKRQVIDHEFRVALYHTRYGVERRKKIIKILKQVRDLYNEDINIPCNRNHTIQLHQDPDFQYFLKKNLFLRVRRGSPSCRHTYLTLKSEAELLREGISLKV